MKYLLLVLVLAGCGDVNVTTTSGGGNSEPPEVVIVDKTDGIATDTDNTITVN